MRPKQRDNRRPAGFRPALDLRPLSLAKDQANYPLFTGEGTENPNNMKTLVAKLKAEPYGSGSMLDPFKEFLQRFWNRVEATADLEVGCNADFTSTIGANSGRTVTFGTATISKLAVEPPWGYADADAGRRLNAWIEPLALSTGLLGAIGIIRACRADSVWRSRSGGSSVKGGPTLWCSTAWPILVKAVHTHMVDNRLYQYQWRDVARRARCLYGEFFNLHGELHRAGSKPEQQEKVTGPLKKQIAAIEAFFDAAFHNKTENMAPFGGRFVVTAKQHPDRLEWSRDFDSFRWTDVSSTHPSGLPLAIMNYYALAIHPQTPGSRPPGFWVSNWFRCAAGRCVRTHVDKKGNCVRQKQDAMPFYAREWKMYICLTQECGAALRVGMALDALAARKDVKIIGRS